MKRNAWKITLIVFLLWLPVLLITLYYASSNIRANRYIDEYEEYYFFRYDYEFPSAFAMDFGTGTGPLAYSRIWLFPSQKEKMLAQIMEDIKILMPEIQEMNEEVILDYEFSEDFRRVILYVKTPKRALPESLTNEVYVSPPRIIPDQVYWTDEIIKRLDIYCEIAYGYLFHDDNGNVIEYRYVDTKTE